MSTAKRFRTPSCTVRRPGETDTHDEESRQRYLRLEQTYLQMAETEDQLVGQGIAFEGASETKPAA